MKKIFHGNSVKTFLLKLLIFAVTVAGADIIVGRILERSYFSQRHGYDYLSTHTIQNTTAPVLFFGSSRAVNIFNPAVAEKEFNLPCFNAGREGQSVFYHYAVLKSVLKRYKPKIVVLSFDAGDFANGRDDYDRISTLLPYYEKNPEIAAVINLKGPFEKIKTISNIYPYNSLVLPILSTTLRKDDKYKDIAGHIPLKRKFNGPLHTMDFTKMSVLDTNKINVYRNFISDCKDANIELHIVCPPYLVNSIGTDASTSVAKKIASAYQVNFFDHSADSFYTSQPALFADFRHLNEKGAELFTEAVAEKISQQ